MGLQGAGGGLTAGKLALANAAATDVVAGITFYAGGKGLQTGTMPDRGAWGTVISPGGAVTVPQGRHNGSGVVRANGASAAQQLSVNDGQGQNKRFEYWWGLGAGLYAFCFVGAVQKDNGAQWSALGCDYNNGWVETYQNSRPGSTFTSLLSGLIHSNGNGTFHIYYEGADSTRQNGFAGTIFRIY